MEPTNPAAVESALLGARTFRRSPAATVPLPETVHDVPVVHVIVKIVVEVVLSVT